jgi:ribosomal protein S27AE
MIPFFTNICKRLLKNNSIYFSDEELFQDATNEFNHHGKRCPNCGAVGCLESHGDYSRGLASRTGDKNAFSSVDVLRFKCKSCGATHALLPDVLVPYSRYGLRFKLSVLIAYFEREAAKMTVVKICESYEIAVSTLYRWKALLLEHKNLLLGLLISAKITGLDFIRKYLNSENSPGPLHQFLCKYGFSFMQSGHKTTSYIPP